MQQTNEAERQFYLAMAGVHLWYAREPLPGAAPSPEFVFPVVPALTSSVLRAHTAIASAVVNAPEKARPSRQSDPAAAARIADLRSLMQPEKTRAAPKQYHPESVAEIAPGVTSKPTSVLVAAVLQDVPSGALTQSPALEKNPSALRPGPALSESLAEVLDVSLTVWRGKRVSLVAALSSDASVKLQHALAHNILSSVGETLVNEDVSVRWPVFNNLLVRGNQPQDLVGVLRPLVSSLNGQNVIVLGITASFQHDQPTADAADNVETSELLSGDELSGALLPAWLSEALPALAAPPMAFRFSLAELAAQSLYKRQLWRAIKSWSN